MDTPNNSRTDYDNITVGLADPHYDARYHGKHTVYFEEIHYAMTRYSSMVGPANFVY